MKAARLVEAYKFDVVDRELPSPRDHEVVIAVTECGVCGSDVDLWLGRAPEKLPMWVGHEIAGVVEHVGPDVTGLQVGDHVVAWVPDGGFAERVIADQSWCVPTRADLAFPAVAEPLACAVNSVELAQPRLGDDVVIVGGGFMGTLIQLLSQLKGPRSVTVISGGESTRERAAALGATSVLAPEQAAVEVVMEQTDGVGADVVYEVSGAEQRLVLASDLVRTSGTLCIAGYHQAHGGDRTVPMALWNAKALSIVNAHFRSMDTIMAGFRAAVRLLDSDVLDLSALVPERHGLDDIHFAFEAARRQRHGFLKAVVEP